MQKKDLQSHMIKLHGAPKPHAVSARLCQGWGPGPLRCWEPAQGGGVAGLEQAGYAVSQGRDSRAALLLTLALPPLSLSVPLVPSASCPGRSCSCTRRSSTAGRSCLCARSAGTGHQAGMACRCTSRPSIGGTVLPGAILPGPSSSGPSSLGCPPQGHLTWTVLPGAILPGLSSPGPACCHSQGPECPHLCPKPAAFLEGGPEG